VTPHAYTEDQLVEQPAIELFAVFGWQGALDALDAQCMLLAFLFHQEKVVCFSW